MNPVSLQSGENTRRLRFTLGLIVFANIACSIYASVEARGMYSDGAAYLVTVYKTHSFTLVSNSRAMVDLFRQWPIVFLSRYTSATLFECAQVFTLVMLTLPTILCALCWSIAPNNEKSWILFPIASLLIGFAATSMNAVGEAAIATSYYWILLFVLLFRTRSGKGQLSFLLLCIPAFWAHEGAFLLTIVLLLCLAFRLSSCRRRWFAVTASLLLMAILTYQITSILDPRYPNDRSDILLGLTRFEFLYFDRHFNLPYLTGILALLILFAAWLVGIENPAKRQIYLRNIAFAWLLFTAASVACSLFMEQSFSPHVQETSRYHPPIISAVLGTSMIVLFKLRLDLSRMGAVAIVILCSLCVTQSVSDLVATHRWNAYVDDLRSRLAQGQGLIPWEETLHTANEPADTNWKLFNKGWIVPYHSIIFAPNGVVKSIIGFPPGTTYRPVDPERSESLPALRGIDYAPYRGFAR